MRHADYEKLCIRSDLRDISLNGDAQSLSRSCYLREHNNRDNKLNN